MGTHTLKTIIVFANKAFIDEAHQKSMSILPELTTPVFESPLNGWRTFYVFPDGSKNGWEEETEADHNRYLLKEWIFKQSSPPISNPVRFAEIAFDECDADVFIKSTNYGQNY